MSVCEVYDKNGKQIWPPKYEKTLMEMTQELIEEMALKDLKQALKADAKAKKEVKK